MKILKILGGLFGLFIAALAVAWVMLIRAPSVEDQCAHVASLMSVEMEGFSGSVVETGFKESCLAKMGMGEHEGMLPYAKKTKCLMAATSMKELEECREASRN